MVIREKSNPPFIPKRLPHIYTVFGGEMHGPQIQVYMLKYSPDVLNLSRHNKEIQFNSIQEIINAAVKYWAFYSAGGSGYKK